MDVIIVCHTELGETKGKDILFTKNPLGVTEGVTNLLRIAKKYNAKVSFALTLEAADYFPKELLKDKSCEIGLHIHPGWEYYCYNGYNWYIGDSILKKKFKSKVNSTVLRDYSYEDQLKMIKTGKAYIKEVSKVTPKFFVAGRWSENNDTIKALVNLGFKHDCTANSSIKSKSFDWSKLSRICMPYYPSCKDYQKHGDLPLLMVPISQFWPKGGVSPEAIPKYSLEWLKSCFLEYYKQDVLLFHICLHSPSMTSLYYIKFLDKLLSFISKREDINFKLTSEIKVYKERNLKTNVWSYLHAVPEFVRTRIGL